jgi:hypothetical protein
MQATKCRTCGQHHWERVCPNADRLDTKHSMKPFGVTRSRNKLPDFVTKSVTHSAAVTKERNTVTKDVTPREVPRSEPASRVKAMQAEIEALHGEVAHLKRQLAEARGGTPKPEPVPAAERMRKMRAAKRAKGQVQFEG